MGGWSRIEHGILSFVEKNHHLTIPISKIILLFPLLFL